MIDNQVEKTKRARFIGIEKFKVLAVQPTKEELGNLGFNTENFKEYYDPEKDTVRIDVIVRRDEENITDKMSFWVQNREQVSDKEPYRKHYVDAHGNFTWCTEEELKNKSFTRNGKNFETGESIQIQYFFPEVTVKVNNEQQIIKARVALIGEKQLTDFIRNWYGFKPSNNCQIPDIQNLFKQDYTALRLLKNKNEVLIPLGIDQSNEYLNYRFYTKAFCDSWGNVISSGWKKDSSKDKLKIAKVLDEDTRKTVFFGESPYEWAEYINVENTEESTSKVNDLPF